MKILIAADGSSFSKRMLEYVIAHPGLFNPDNEYMVLTVVLGVPLHAAAVVGTETVTEYYADEAERVLKPVRQFFEMRGYKVNTTYQVGHPAEVIAKTATSGQYDVVVMGSHFHAALGNLVIGSVATKVLAHCKTPVLIVR
jgi:nucleotide-binding universal stress UspA family protein